MRPEDPARLLAASERAELVRALLGLRDDLRGLGAPVGVLFRAAEVIATDGWALAEAGLIARADEPEGPRCAGCGFPLQRPPGRGRPRKWCGKGRCEGRSGGGEIRRNANSHRSTGGTGDGR